MIELGVGEIPQIANHRAPVAGENIERVGDGLRVVLVRLGRVDDLVAQPVERLIERLLRDGETAFARAGEEVGDEGVEPHVVMVAVGAPHAEGAAGALAGELPFDRLANASVEIGIDGEMFDRGETVGVEERHRAAHRLLRAAIGIPVERLQQRRRVERAEGRGGDRDRAGSGNEIGEEVAGDRLRRAARQRRHRAPVDIGRAREDAQFEMLRQIGLRPGEPQVEIGRTDAGGGDRHRQGLALTGG